MAQCEWIVADLYAAAELVETARTGLVLAGSRLARALSVLINSALEGEELWLSLLVVVVRGEYAAT